MASLSALALLLAVGSPLVSAQSNICYNRFGQAYRCNGLNNAARIGIGVAVGVGVLLLICLIATMRRRSLQRNFARYRPPAGGLAYAQNTGNTAPMGYSYGQGNNPYANNPPPPQGYQGQQDSSWSNAAYGAGVSTPAATYQPGARAADAKYNAGTGAATGTGNGIGNGQNDHEHGYEWEQAREQERLEREQQQQGMGMGAPPPGYDASVGNSRPIVSGTTTSGNDGFAPPPGPPPTK